MIWLRRLVAIAIFVATLVFGWTFAKRNAAPVQVDYLVGTLAEPGWLVVLETFLLGALVTAVLLSFHVARLALTARRFRRLANGLEGEVHQLRNLPLATPEPEPARGGAVRNPAAGGTGRSG